MVQFMSAATVQNLPSYLAEDRARRSEANAMAAMQAESAQQDAVRREGYAREDAVRYEGYDREDALKSEEEKKKEALAARMRKLGQEFMSSGDYTPKGLKTFAEKHEMSMPEMKGMVDMVVSFKKISAKDKQALINVRPQGANYTVRTEDQAGLRSFDKPDATPAGAGPAAGETAGKVEDWQRFARDTLKSSLGYSAETGWPDLASQKKFDTVLYNTDKSMAGRTASDVIGVLNKEINAYDGGVNVSDAVKKIPADSVLTTKKDAKKAVDEAKAAGALKEDIKAELKAKGWEDKEIETIIRDADPSNPLGL